MGIFFGPLSRELTSLRNSLAEVESRIENYDSLAKMDIFSDLSTIQNMLSPFTRQYRRQLRGIHVAILEAKRLHPLQTEKQIAENIYSFQEETGLPSYIVACRLRAISVLVNSIWNKCVDGMSWPMFIRYRFRQLGILGAGRAILCRIQKEAFLFFKNAIHSLRPTPPPQRFIPFSGRAFKIGA